MGRLDKLRKILFSISGDYCYYCNVKYIQDRHNKYYNKFHKTIDHIFPRSLGGLDTFDNLRVCCNSCNKTKGSLLETEFIKYTSKYFNEVNEIEPDNFEKRVEVYSQFSSEFMGSMISKSHRNNKELGNVITGFEKKKLQILSDLKNYKHTDNKKLIFAIDSLHAVGKKYQAYIEISSDLYKQIYGIVTGKKTEIIKYSLASKQLIIIRNRIMNNLIYAVEKECCSDCGVKTIETNDDVFYKRTEKHTKTKEYTFVNTICIRCKELFYNSGSINQSYKYYFHNLVKDLDFDDYKSYDEAYLIFKSYIDNMKKISKLNKTLKLEKHGYAQFFINKITDKNKILNKLYSFNPNHKILIGHELGTALGVENVQLGSFEILTAKELSGYICQALGVDNCVFSNN